MTRGDAMTGRRRRTMVVAACAALLLSGCGGADEPAGSDEPEEAAAALETAPAAESSCADGVTFEWSGSPTTKDLYAEVQVVRVTADGDVDVRNEWNRADEAGAVPASDATEEQQAMVRDAVAGGLVEVVDSPRVDDADEALGDAGRGTYVLYAFAEHTAGTATVACADGSSEVEVRITSFEDLDTGVADCEDSPDPVAEFAAAGAIANYCERG